MNLLRPASSFLQVADRVVARGAWFAVRLYRHFLSPYKGFVCAHGALTGRASCAEYAERVLARTGWTRALPLIRRQFARCRHTYAVASSRDMFDAAQEHLSQFSTLAAAGVLACPCVPGDDSPQKPGRPLPPGRGPLGSVRAN